MKEKKQFTITLKLVVETNDEADAIAVGEEACEALKDFPAANNCYVLTVEDEDE